MAAYYGGRRRHDWLFIGRAVADVVVGGNIGQSRPAAPPPAPPIARPATQAPEPARPAPTPAWTADDIAVDDEPPLPVDAPAT